MNVCHLCLIFIKISITYCKIQTLRQIWSFVALIVAFRRTFQYCTLQIWEKEKNKLEMICGVAEMYDCTFSLSTNIYHLTKILNAVNELAHFKKKKKGAWLPACVLHCGSPVVLWNRKTHKYLCNEVKCKHNLEINKYI